MLTELQTLFESKYYAVYFSPQYNLLTIKRKNSKKSVSITGTEAIIALFTNKKDSEADKNYYAKTFLQ